MEAFTLYDLNNRIKQVLKRDFAEAVWITAEITEIQLNSSGHCYLQLADKKEEDSNIVATARATIWAFVFRTLRPYFETVTGRSLSKGMKVLLNVEVVFHEVYGFSLNVKDIDPTYTVGDLERKKQEILLQLQEEGIMDMNRGLAFPALPKNIAVISSPTAAGWGDFRNQLEQNPYHYRFHIRLFPAVMQGEKTAESVIAALDRIYEYESLFDVVVIIRGGGSQTDLGCFDSYELASNVAQFPLPVIAGIGHERDETIVDRVAYMRVKTPTAAAAFLIEAFQEQEKCLEDRKHRFRMGVRELMHQEAVRQLTGMSGLKRSVQALLAGEGTSLKILSHRVERATQLYMGTRLSGFEKLKDRLENRIVLLLERQKDCLHRLKEGVGQKAGRMLEERQRRLEMVMTMVKYVDPNRVLKQGYSITRLNGKAVRDAALLKPGDCIETEMAQGKVSSKVMEK